MKGKKILSMILSLVLAVSMIGAVPAKAASSYTQIKFTGISNADATKLDGDFWYFYLTTEGYSSSDWSYKYEGFKYEIDGVEGTAAEVSSTEGSGIWFKIPASDVSIEEGTILTIKAGNYGPGANSAISDGIYLTEDFHLVYSGSKWLANLNIVDVADGTARLYSNGAFYFNLKDDNGNIIGPGSPTWDYFLWPCDWSNALINANFSSFYSSVYIDDVAVTNFDGFLKYTPELDNAFYMNLANYTIENGTTVTVKGGFVTREQTDGWPCVAYYFFREFSFRYDGSSWSFVKPTTYTNVTLTGTLEAHSKCNDEATQWNLYLTNAGGVESIGWAYTYQGLNYQIGGTSYTMEKMQGTEEGLKHTLYCYIPTSVLPADAPNGTEIVIKAGNYDWADANANQGLAIQNDLTLIVRDGILIKKPVAGTPTFKEGNGSKGFYFTTTDEITFPYDSAWGYKTYAVDEADSGVFHKGTKIAAFLQKYDKDAWYVNIEAAGISLNAGDKITLKGNFIYEATDGSKHRIEFQDTSLVFNGTTYEPYVSTYNDITFTELSSSTDNNNGTKWYLYIVAEGTIPGVAWDAVFEGVQVLVGGQEITSNVTVKNSGGSCLLFDIEASALAPEPENGTVVTIKAGRYKGVNGVGEEIEGIRVTEDYAIEWNGTAWIEYVERDRFSGTLSVVGAQVLDTYSDNCIYLKGTDGYASAGDGWSDDYKLIASGGSVKVGDTIQEGAYFKKYDAGNNWYYLGGLENVVEGSVVTVEGDFISADNAAVVTFSQAKFTWNGSKWVDGEWKYYEGTPRLYSEGQGKYGSAEEFYFKSEDGVPNYNWADEWKASDGDENGVFVYDADAATPAWTKTSSILKKVDVTNWYVDLAVQLSAGDKVRIQGDFYLGNSIVTFTQKEFVFTGTHFQEGTFTPTDFTITGLSYSGISYDASAGQWNMYFTISNDIPGDAGSTIYPFVVYDIDGVEYTANAMKTNHKINDDAHYDLYIPIKELPQTLEKEYVVTIKECSSQGRYADTTFARTDGIHLTEDYVFVVGTQYDASAPTIDYSSANGGDANGIYLFSGDDFPNLGWDCTLTKVGDSSGITVDGVETGRPLKKVGDATYYISLTDNGGSGATEGTIVMLKGAFTYNSLYSVTFKTAKYIYTGEKWEVFKATVNTGLTSGVIGDANGKDDKANSADLVHIKKFLAQEANEIYVDVDLNSSGDIDKYDTRLLRWLLINGIDYRNGSNMTGVPTYTNTKDVMRLAAYVTPTDAQGMANYKSANFTTLLSEHLAQYESDGFDAYMKNAEAAGLDVLVESGYIRNLAIGNAEYNEATLRAIYDNLTNNYPNSFRGFFMGDEPLISQLDTFTNVVNVLKSFDPEIELYVACWPTYVEDEGNLSSDTSLSLDEKYAGYANAYGDLLGEFTYDFYPFQYTYNKFLSWVVKEDYIMREDWFRNLELVASNGKGSYKTGITIQSHEAANTSDTTYYRATGKEDISFQAYSALAYGVKSISYFTYGEHWDDSSAISKCMENDATIYNAVRDVNKEIQEIDHILLNYNWQGTMAYYEGDDDDGIMQNVAKYESKRIDSWEASNDAIIGCLKDVNAYDGFMLVNAKDPIDNASVNMTVTFNNATDAKVYVAGKELADNSAYITKNGNNTVTFNATLAPGQGIFVIPYMN